MRLVDQENEQLRRAGMMPAVTAALLIRTWVGRYAAQVGLAGELAAGQATSPQEAGALT